MFHVSLFIICPSPLLENTTSPQHYTIGISTALRFHAKFFTRHLNISTTTLP